MLFLKMNLHRKLVFNWLNRAYLPRTINIQICKKKKKKSKKQENVTMNRRELCGYVAGFCLSTFVSQY